MLDVKQHWMKCLTVGVVNNKKIYAPELGGILIHCHMVMGLVMSRKWMKTKKTGMKMEALTLKHLGMMTVWIRSNRNGVYHKDNNGKLAKMLTDIIISLNPMPMHCGLLSHGYNGQMWLPWRELKWYVCPLTEAPYTCSDGTEHVLVLSPPQKRTDLGCVMGLSLLPSIILALWCIPMTRRNTNLFDPLSQKLTFQNHWHVWCIKNKARNHSRLCSNWQIHQSISPPWDVERYLWFQIIHINTLQGWRVSPVLCCDATACTHYLDYDVYSHWKDECY